MTGPLISVIVPVYDVQDHVGPCLQSLRAQSLTDFEVILVDDGSRDASLPRAREAIGTDRRFRILHQENRGLSGARNTGLEAARGAFVAFLDSDDRVEPDWLEALYHALCDSGADMAASAIRLVWPSGSSVHSAIHGAPELPPGRGPLCIDMTDWRTVIRHFPSAWNKLYRRELIEGLRFDEGTWFEDHAFYWQVARRCRRMVHLDRPLYLHSRARPGQITGQDSERVFEQIAVLDRLAGLLPAPGMRGGKAALARLASRLLYERAQVLRDPDRRRRFAAAGAAFLSRHGLRFDPGWDRHIDRGWGLVMQGELPLSVIVPSDGAPEPLAATLAALEAQGMPWLETLVICDHDRAAGALVPLLAGYPAVRLVVQPGQGAGAARNHGLALAQGVLVSFQDAGDLPAPGALAAWGNALLERDAEAGLSSFRVGLGGSAHSALHDMRGLGPLPTGMGLLRAGPEKAPQLHGHPSAWIFRRDFLRAADIRFGTGPRPEWQVALAAGVRARRLAYFGTPWVEVSERPEARRLWRTPLRAGALARALDAACATLDGHERAALPQGWRRRLFVRAAWEQIFCVPRGLVSRAGFSLAFALACRRRNLHRERGAVDPYVGWRLLRLLGLRADVASARESPHNAPQ